MYDDLDFERMPKTAFWGAARQLMSPLAKRLGFSGGIGIGRHLSSRGKNPLLQKIMPYGTRAEQLLTQGVGKIAPNFAPTFGRAIKGTSRAAMREGFGGAVAGGVFGGGLNAAFANEGERGQAFMSGALSGAGLGALSGAVSGGAGGVVRNLRAKQIQDMAKTQGVKPGVIGKQVFKMPTFWGSKENPSAIRGAFGKEKTPLRDVSRAKLMGGTGAAAASWVLPELVMPHAPEPPAPPPAPSQPQIIPNQPAAYYQHQKASSVREESYASRLKTPDFSRLLR
jgi:hypothetical protein